MIRLRITKIPLMITATTLIKKTRKIPSSYLRARKSKIKRNRKISKRNKKVRKRKKKNRRKMKRRVERTKLNKMRGQIPMIRGPQMRAQVQRRTTKIRNYCIMKRKIIKQM